jgi:hypothetical protein
MKRPIRSQTLAGAMTFALCLIVFAGCSSIRPVTSTPPVSAIVVSEGFTVHELSRENFPAGEYKPVFEDGDGFYYQAPIKVIANLMFTYVGDGGLYLKNGEKEPSQWYFITEGGHMTRGTFTVAPKCELKP